MVGESLGSPGVGTWRCAVANGQVIHEGVILGRLKTFGVERTIVAPSGAVGNVVRCVSDGVWVEYGQVLVELGEASHPGQAPSVAATDERLPEGVVTVMAETDGTVFLRPEPGAEAFVSQGDRVSSGETLALIEVMKTFTPVRSAGAGIMQRICVEDASAVGEGQVLFWLRPG